MPQFPHLWMGMKIVWTLRAGELTSVWNSAWHMAFTYFYKRTFSPLEACYNLNIVEGMVSGEGEREKRGVTYEPLLGARHCLGISRNI